MPPDYRMARHDPNGRPHRQSRGCAGYATGRCRIAPRRRKDRAASSAMF